MNRIAYFREKNKLTQRDLAKKLNCSCAAIAMYETGQRKPALSKARELAKIFDTSIEEIFFNDSANELLAIKDAKKGA